LNVIVPTAIGPEHQTADDRIIGASADLGM